MVKKAAPKQAKKVKNAQLSAIFKSSSAPKKKKVVKGSATDKSAPKKPTLSELKKEQAISRGEESEKKVETTPAEPAVEVTPEPPKVKEIINAPQARRSEIPLAKPRVKKEEKPEEKTTGLKIVQMPKKEHFSRPRRPAPPRSSSPNVQSPPQVPEPHSAGRGGRDEGRKSPSFGGGKILRPQRKLQEQRKSRYGIRSDQDDRWQGRKKQKQQVKLEDVVRPDSIEVSLPISVADLAEKLKLKATQVIKDLIFGGIAKRIGDVIEDDGEVDFVASKYNVAINFQQTEDEKLSFGKSIKEEIESTDEKLLKPRAPVVAFMGHVDHGKTTLIDRIRQTNVAAGEAGAITQHIGAFKAKTDHGEICILDTPGHEAFTAMRQRGALATDIVVLVVAGNEGVKDQTKEAIKHARMADAKLIVAMNKCDLPTYKPEQVQNELANEEILSEEWGGDTIFVKCSGETGEGIDKLLESILLLAEVEELKANPSAPARGSVLEAQMHKGLGAVATVLVQNGTLKKGDFTVFGASWGRTRLMQNEYGKNVEKATPSTPVKITGLSAVPEAGDEFIVVESEKEAKDFASARAKRLAAKELAAKKQREKDNQLIKDAEEKGFKIFNLIIRGDVKGSVEALESAVEEIDSDKAKVNVIFSGVGEIKESDVDAACTQNATILCFQNRTDKHVEERARQLQVSILKHKVLYAAIDAIKEKMKHLLDKLVVEEDRGKALIKETFHFSKVGQILGCEIMEGMAHRNYRARIMRDGEEVFRGDVKTLKRLENDVKEVKNGLECGITLTGNFKAIQGDTIEFYELVEQEQELS